MASRNHIDAALFGGMVRLKVNFTRQVAVEAFVHGLTDISRRSSADNSNRFNKAFSVGERVKVAVRGQGANPATEFLECDRGGEAPFPPEGGSRPGPQWPKPGSGGVARCERPPPAALRRGDPAVPNNIW